MINEDTPAVPSKANEEFSSNYTKEEIDEKVEIFEALGYDPSHVRQFLERQNSSSENQSCTCNIL